MNNLLQFMIPLYIRQIEAGLRTRDSLPAHILDHPDILKALEAQEGAENEQISNQ